MSEGSAISTGSLTLYYTLLKTMESKCSAFVANDENKNDPTYAESVTKLKALQANLTSVQGELDRRRGTLKYSVEDIYKLIGQTDSYAMINFYPGSPAYEKYGETVHGIVWYLKRDRENLDAAISNEGYTRNNGIVYLGSGIEDAEKKRTLQFDGFEANDIMEIYRSGPAGNKAYQQEGTKSIPHTINVKIDSNFDVVGAQQYVLGGYLKMGYTLPLHDLVIYYRNLLLFQPEKLNEADKEKYLLNADQSDFVEEVDFSIHEVKVQQKIATDAEKQYYGTLLKKRADQRMNVIKQQLGISEKAINDLILSDIDRYMTLYQSAWMFETETLAYLAPNANIYWDFERFIHIFLRHNPEFFIAASSKGQGTSFQYSFQDIQRVVKVVIQQLKDPIIEKLSAGKPFVINGLYYNGNHYQLRIEADGRLMQFHPLD